MTFYEAIGGEPTFRKLVDEFYVGVATDPLLRPMYPEADLGPAADRLALFLMQYWGGPGTYSAQRGHPRLRMRHATFRVDAVARDAWLLHMRRAVDSLALPPQYATALWEYLERAAYFMVNTVDEEPGAGQGTAN
ncbi:globin [Micromonospora sp. CPCC 206060]|uniref:globin n=1 Tax=Micromonospora sp. CPCC 206060 TaxID=3122406 RepID=UPI002FF34735